MTLLFEILWLSTLLSTSFHHVFHNLRYVRKSLVLILLFWIIGGVIHQGVVRFQYTKALSERLKRKEEIHQQQQALERLEDRYASSTEVLFSLAELAYRLNDTQRLITLMDTLQVIVPNDPRITRYDDVRSSE